MFVQNRLPPQIVPTLFGDLTEEGITIHSPKEAKKKVNEFARDNFQKICADTEYRLKNYSSDPALLDHGIYYSNDYYLALNKIENKREVLLSLRENGYFYHGLVSKKFFMFLPDPNSLTGIGYESYVLNEGVCPIEALKAIFEEVTFFDCGNVINLAYHIALAKVLGIVKYKTIFSEESMPRNRLKPQMSRIEPFLNLIIPFIKNNVYL